MMLIKTTTAAAAVLLLPATLCLRSAQAFQIRSYHHHENAAAATITKRGPTTSARLLLAASNDEDEGKASSSGGGGVEEYRNAPTAVLSNFMKPMDDDSSNPGSAVTNPIDSIDFAAPKFLQGRGLGTTLGLDTFAAVLDAELYEREWFVTGNVNPIYFSDDFEFQDPDVKLKGIEEYARGVYRLFDQETSRAEIISTVANDTVPNTITCTWRLSGKVNIGPGLTIKPYLCYTDFTVDESTGLITFQEDRFDVPQWDILLSALFPFLVGRVTSPPAPPVEPRVVKMPDIPMAKGRGGSPASAENEASGPLGRLLQMFGGR